uniref:Uncharacterized protein n=1 Tax=uncultured Candidatus Melainabacteria bacterium TaxID=2682970 RepID=A0A650EKZ8_9BACT|nr:hypothetical protein Melaina855_1750 [uncultured Candidatus Melainabacteria bacterium]
MNINPLNDAENIRQQRNLTNSQRKNNLSIKEGVLVNNLVKDKSCNLNTTKDTYIISDQSTMPEALYQDNKIIDKKLIPLSTIALGVMSTITIITGFARHSAKIAKDLPKEKWLPAVTRNVQLSRETHQLIYQFIQNPNKKTFIAGAGVLTLSAMAFMGKTFFDGYKDIWVKRKEANIQKNLQENLITVETQSFSGKMQIIRSMLSKYTKDFEKYLKDDNEKILPNFEKKLFSSITFQSENKNDNKSTSNFGNIVLGIGTFTGIIGLGFLAIKNLSKSKHYLKEGVENTKELIQAVVKKSDTNSKNIDEDFLEHMFMSIDDGAENLTEFITKQINLLNWKSEDKNTFLKKILTKLKTSTTKANPNYAGDGTPRPAFNSFVEDYRAFFYNWLLDTNNPQFKYLFYGITGLTAATYGGKLAGDAIKEVQVKKINAETELELQKKLVSTELRNFKSKKDAAIQPLVEEFYKQVDSGKRSKEELKTMAENILFEIKNGPPFVYS